MRKIALLFAALLAYAGMAFAAVNINSATKEQLESLDGIGPVKAQAIVDYRKKNGSFKRLEDIKNVDGVGDATYVKIRGEIALSGTTKVSAPAATTPAKPAMSAAKPEPTPAARADEKKMKAETKADDKKAKADADEKKAKAKAEAEAKKAKAKAEADEKKAKTKAEADASKAKSKAEADEAKAKAAAKQGEPKK